MFEDMQIIKLSKVQLKRFNNNGTEEISKYSTTHRFGDKKTGKKIPQGVKR
jgi:hypothetical protein